MNSKKKQGPAIFLFFLTCMLLASSTYAWISMNREVYSGGLVMSMETFPGLVISKESGYGEGQIGNALIESVNARLENNYTITYVSGREAMLPATHDWAVGTTTGLKYVSNLEIIGFLSGLPKGGASLSFTAVPEDPESTYYIDFEAYIASVNKTMTNTDLIASLSLSGAALTAETEYLKATTIDFYVGSVASNNYKGSINIRDSGTDTVNLTNDTHMIPLNTSGSIRVIARCYFDGALKENESDTETYVRSYDAGADKVRLKITFEAVTNAG